MIEFGSVFFNYILYGLRNQDFNYVIIGLMILLGAIFCIVMHEIAHGTVAKWNGDYTAQGMGRLTLNPVKHFDLVGFFVFAVVGFGWAKPVPVNPNNFRHYRKGMFSVAIAGVATNLILAFLCYPIAILLSQNVSDFWGFAFFQMFAYMFNINLILIVFNLLPIYPLDGFRVIEALGRNKFWRKYKNFMYQYGFIVMICTLIFVFFLAEYIGISIFGYLANLVGRPITTFWSWIL